MTISPYAAWPADSLCQHGICIRPAVAIAWEPIMGKGIPLCHEHASLAAHRRQVLRRSA